MVIFKHINHDLISRAAGGAGPYLPHLADMKELRLYNACFNYSDCIFGWPYKNAEGIYIKGAAAAANEDVDLKVLRQVTKKAKELGAVFVEDLDCYILSRSAWNNLNVEQLDWIHSNLMPYMNGVVVNDYTPWNFDNRYPQKDSSNMPTLILKTCGKDENRTKTLAIMGANPIDANTWMISGHACTPEAIQSLNELRVIDGEVHPDAPISRTFANILDNIVPNDYQHDATFANLVCPDQFQHDYDYLIAKTLDLVFGSAKLAKLNGAPVHAMVTYSMTPKYDPKYSANLCKYASDVLAGDIGLCVHVFFPNPDPDNSFITVYHAELCGNPGISTYGEPCPWRHRRGDHFRPGWGLGPVQLNDYQRTVETIKKGAIFKFLGTARAEWKHRALGGGTLETRSFVINSDWVRKTIDNGHFIPSKWPVIV